MEKVNCDDAIIIPKDEPGDAQWRRYAARIAMHFAFKLSLT